MKNKLSIGGVIAQVAVVTICIFGCGAFLESLSAKGSVKAGPFEDRLIHIDMALSGLEAIGFEEVYSRLGQIEAGLLELGGVEAVSTSSALPLSNGGWTRALIEGEPLESEPEWISFCYVTPQYFDTVGVKILEGRDFRPDEASAWPPKNYMINKAYAEREFSGFQALGRRIAPWDGVGFGEVIGIVENQIESVGGDVRPNIYIPIYRDRFILNVRLSDPTLVKSHAKLIAEKIEQVDSGAVIVSIEDIDTIWEQALSSPKLGFIILLSLSLIGLFLSLSGVFGYQSYIVALRDREFAIRHAIGQASSDIYWSEVRRGLTIAVAGFALGATGFYAGTRVFASALFDVSLPLLSALWISIALMAAFFAILLTATLSTKSPKLEMLIRE